MNEKENGEEVKEDSQQQPVELSERDLKQVSGGVKVQHEDFAVTQVVQKSTP
jgi:hypothetical protein